MPGLGTKITKFTSVIVVNLKYLYRDTVLFSDCFGYKSIFSHCLHTFVPPFLLSSGIFCLFSVCIGFLPLELTRFPLFWKTLPLVGSKASLSCQICRLYGSHTLSPVCLFVCLFRIPIICYFRHSPLLPFLALLLLNFFAGFRSWAVASRNSSTLSPLLLPLWLYLLFSQALFPASECGPSPSI